MSGGNSLWVYYGFIKDDFLINYEHFLVFLNETTLILKFISRNNRISARQKEKNHLYDVKNKALKVIFILFRKYLPNIYITLCHN